MTFQERALGTWFLSDDRILDQATAPLTSRILEKQPKPQNVFQWKTTRISKCFSMKNNHNLKMFLNEKKQSFNSLHLLVRAPSKGGTDFFLSKVRNVYLNLPPDGKLSSLELSGEVCEQITQMLKIIRHKGLTIYF